MGESHGGLFDSIWMKGERVWIQTEKRLGQGMEWLANAGSRISVREARGRPGDRHRLRNAVLGRWLRWEETGSEHRSASAEFVVADAGSAHCATEPEGVGEVGDASAKQTAEGEPSRSEPRVESGEPC